MYNFIVNNDNLIFNDCTFIFLKATFKNIKHYTIYYNITTIIYYNIITIIYIINVVKMYVKSKIKFKKLIFNIYKLESRF